MKGFIGAILLIGILITFCYGARIDVIYSDPYECQIIYKVPEAFNLVVYAPTGWYRIHLDYNLPFGFNEDLDGWVYLKAGD